MPPTIGAAIGFITSEPMPVSQRIGTKLASTAVTVISFGRSRWTAPSIAAASMSAFGKQRNGVQLTLKRFMQIHDHHHAGFHRNPEQRDIADPNRYAEVVAKQPLQQQSAGHGVDGWKNQDQRPP